MVDNSTEQKNRVGYGLATSKTRMPSILNNDHSFVLLIIVLILLFELSRYKWLWKLFTNAKSSSKSPKLQVMKSKSEKDCPYCRKVLASGNPPPPICTHIPTPWSQKKGKGGRKKTVCITNTMLDLNGLSNCAARYSICR